LHEAPALHSKVHAPPPQIDVHVEPPSHWKSH
jgi:hypothetical protein